MSSYYSVLLTYGNESIIVDGEKACRVCLSTKCKLIDLHSNNLAEELSELTGTEVQLGDGLPQYLCTFCCTLLQKGTAFKKRCRSVVSLFQTILSNNDLVTKVISGTKLKCDVQISHLKNSFGTSQLLNMEIPVRSQENYDDTSNIDVNDVCLDVGACVELIDSNNDEEELKPTLKNEVVETDPLEVQACDMKDAIKLEPDNDGLDSQTELSGPWSNNLVDDNGGQSIEDTGDSKECLKEILPDINCTRKRKSLDVICSNVKATGEASVGSPAKINRKETQVMKLKNDDIDKSEDSEFDDTQSEDTQSDDTESEDTESDESSDDNNILKLMSILESVTNSQKNSKKRQLLELLTGMNKDIDTSDDTDSDDTDSDKSTDFEEEMDKLWSDIESEMQDLQKKREKMKKEEEEEIRNMKARQESEEYQSSKYKCEQCYTGFMVEDIYKRHMISHDPAAEYRCSVCDVHFLHSKAYRKHVDTAPSAGCKDVRPCEHCGVNLTTEDLLLQHLQTEHEMKLRCDMCGLIFQSVFLYKKHRSNAHEGTSGESKESKFFCEECDENFQSNESLEEHRRVHSTEKPYQCTFCWKRFKVKALLKQHKSAHAGGARYKCPQCPKTYKTAGFRKRHLLVHKKEKRQPCPICGKLFHLESTVDVHIVNFHLEDMRHEQTTNK